jgi:hypothetical protein
MGKPDLLLSQVARTHTRSPEVQPHSDDPRQAAGGGFKMAMDADEAFGAGSAILNTSDIENSK